MLKIFAAYGKANSNNVKYQFWQQDNHPIELSSNEEIEQKLDYIHENPVKHGFTNSSECYYWSSAVDYYGGKAWLILRCCNIKHKSHRAWLCVRLALGVLPGVLEERKTTVARRGKRAKK